MPTSAFYKFEDFKEKFARGEHHLHAAGDTLKVFLTNSSVTAAGTVKSDYTDLSTGGGYTAGGEDIQNDMTESGGTATVTAVDVTWTATTGFGPFRYAVIYNDTHASDALVCYFDYGVGGVTVGASEQFVVDFGASLFTLA
jgi:hypothetical protein